MVNTEQNIPIEYCLYVRKSSESDERQAMSIDSQLKEMRSLAKKAKKLSRVLPSAQLPVQARAL